MNKIAVIGDGESVLPYRAFGFVTFAAEAQDSGEVIRQLFSDEEFRIIFILEEFAIAQQELLKEMRVSERTYPIVIEIPGIHGSQGHSQRRLNNIIERAVGADILSKEGC